MAMPDTVAAMQAAISADVALLARITELERTMLGGRMARLAAHFQAAGLTVDESAAMPANIASSREQLLQVRDLFGIYTDTDSANDENEAEARPSHSAHLYRRQRPPNRRAGRCRN